MSRYFSYINSSKKILDSYDGVQPFPFHLKKQFAANKQFGSKDRKTIAEICYAWLRTSHLFNRSLQDDSLTKAMFLCSHKSHLLLAALAPQLDERVEQHAEEKLQFLQMNMENIFPFHAGAGNIDKPSFLLSFLTQPLLFLRLRPGKQKLVRDKLLSTDIACIDIEEDCIALENATKLDEIINLNKEAVVQDRNSQKVFDYLQQVQLPEGKINVWDCCAASGGKSILLFDRLNGNIKLTVSDIRTNILQNCKTRLREAGININHAFVADVSAMHEQEPDKNFSIIICDAPCTGSGTWSRTPEQLAYFKEGTVEAFSSLQQKISINAARFLNPGGIFFYITCSVFEKENEEVVKYLQQQSGMQVLHSQYLSGYHDRADTMYVAVFKK